MDVKEAGRKGGLKTAKQHTKEFYQTIGKKGASIREANKKKRLEVA